MACTKAAVIASPAPVTSTAVTGGAAAWVTLDPAGLVHRAERAADERRGAPRRADADVVHLAGGAATLARGAAARPRPTMADSSSWLGVSASSGRCGVSVVRQQRCLGHAHRVHDHRHPGGGGVVQQPRGRRRAGCCRRGRAGRQWAMQVARRCELADGEPVGHAHAGDGDEELAVGIQHREVGAGASSVGIRWSTTTPAARVYATRSLAEGVPSDGGHQVGRGAEPGQVLGDVAPDAARVCSTAAARVGACAGWLRRRECALMSMLAPPTTTTERRLRPHDVAAAQDDALLGEVRQVHGHSGLGGAERSASAAASSSGSRRSRSTMSRSRWVRLMLES